MENTFIETLAATRLPHDIIEKCEKDLETDLKSEETVAPWVSECVNKFKEILLQLVECGNYRVENDKRTVEGKYDVNVPKLSENAKKLAQKLCADRSLDFSRFDILHHGNSHLCRFDVYENWGVQKNGATIQTQVTHHRKRHFWSKSDSYVKTENVPEYGFGHFSAFYFDKLKKRLEEEGIFISKICTYKKDFNGSSEGSPINSTKEIKKEEYEHSYCMVYFYAVY